MGKHFAHINAIGQINDMACWAASLAWWYRAEKSIHASQQALYDLYKHLATQQGGMTNSGIEFVINQNAMHCAHYRDSTFLDAHYMKGLLELGPVFLAYVATGTAKRHVNVVYDIIGSGPWAEVLVMEPQASENGDGTWTGEHQRRSLSDYNAQGEIFAGVNRKKWDRWINS